jgi:DNA-binding IclR family transcriptional regulator
MRQSHRHPADTVDSADGKNQNIARAALVLQTLAESGNSGLRLTDVARLTGLSKTATHRCLAGLTTHGLAMFDQDDARFFLGDRIFSWTVLAGERYELAERVMPYLRRLAEESKDTAYFLLRRGDDAICYGRAVGSYPIKTLTLNVGDKRPLGVGSGPLAILAFLGDAEIERLMRTQAAARKRFGISDESLRQMIAAARAYGYSTFGEQLIKGMAGVGVPVRNARGMPVAAFSIAAIASRMEPERRKKLAQSLRKAATLIQNECQHLF